MRRKRQLGTGDSEYLTDSFIVEFHRKIYDAQTQLRTAAVASAATTVHGLAIETLRIQTEINDTLRAILGTLRNRYGTIPSNSGDEGRTNGPKTGRKRSAPRGDGKEADGGKKPRTK
ncbi:hypothetical protein FCIRC_13279 [Fusarium circinatum]|uniref:Uncharacterized protein n=1 Tax=Fusarium circinatum TaxID=48490 RepID=A0A8H5SQZ7_FUSCI|nr:hypothetical protein FCIRC_13279 [Fusarium circinatum]